MARRGRYGRSRPINQKWRKPRETYRFTWPPFSDRLWTLIGNRTLNSTFPLHSRYISLSNQLEINQLTARLAAKVVINRPIIFWPISWNIWHETPRFWHILTINTRLLTTFLPKNWTLSTWENQKSKLKQLWHY